MTPADQLRPSAPRDALLGKVVAGRYEIVGPLGRGGMGAVYEARQIRLDRRVALKVLTHRHASLHQRFLLEASVTARLTHPNSVTLLDFGKAEDGSFFLAMELLSGRTLARAIAQDGALAQNRVIHIAQQICRSLREAHALGVVHRDLKPANVFLLTQQDDHDFVKVLDFGLAAFFSATGGAGGLDNAALFQGTAHYLSPEQARNEAPDHRGDIYSLGVLLFHMLAGKLPFTAKSSVDVIDKHIHCAPPPLRLVHPDLEQIVLRCLEKRREDRFQSMDAVLSALKAVRLKLRARSQEDAGSLARRGFARECFALPTPPNGTPLVVEQVPRAEGLQVFSRRESFVLPFEHARLLAPKPAGEPIAQAPLPEPSGLPLSAEVPLAPAAGDQAALPELPLSAELPLAPAAGDQAALPELPLSAELPLAPAAAHPRAATLAEVLAVTLSDAPAARAEQRAAAAPHAPTVTLLDAPVARRGPRALQAALPLPLLALPGPVAHDAAPARPAELRTPPPPALARTPPPPALARTPPPPAVNDALLGPLPEALRSTPPMAAPSMAAATPARPAKQPRASSVALLGAVAAAAMALGAALMHLAR